MMLDGFHILSLMTNPTPNSAFRLSVCLSVRSFYRPFVLPSALSSVRPFVCPSVTPIVHSPFVCLSLFSIFVWVTRPEVPKGEVERREGPPARSRGLEGAWRAPSTSCRLYWLWKWV